jgi:hypothetical protein
MIDTARIEHLRREQNRLRSAPLRYGDPNVYGTASDPHYNERRCMEIYEELKALGCENPGGSCDPAANLRQR